VYSLSWRLLLAVLVAFGNLQFSQIRGRQPYSIVRNILYVILDTMPLADGLGSTLEETARLSARRRPRSPTKETRPAVEGTGRGCAYHVGGPCSILRHIGVLMNSIEVSCRALVAGILAVATDATAELIFASSTPRATLSG